MNVVNTKGKTKLIFIKMHTGSTFSFINDRLERIHPVKRLPRSITLYPQTCYIAKIDNIPTKDGKFTWKWLKVWACTEEECVNAAKEYHTEVKIQEVEKPVKLCKSTTNPVAVTLFQF